MRFAFVADVHLGNHKRHGGQVTASINERCRLALEVFDDAICRAQKLGADEFIVAGDLLHRHDAHPQLVSETLKIIQTRKDIGCTLMLGNHEHVSTDEGDNALAPFHTVAQVDEEPSCWEFDSSDGQVDTLLTVPFRPGVVADDWLPEEVDKLLEGKPASRRMLAIHMGIKDDTTVPWLKDSPAAVDVEVLFSLVQKHDLMAVFAGDWHDHRAWRAPGGAPIIQLGALVPTGWSNPGLDGYGTLAMLDTETGQLHIEHLPGPRFVKLDIDEKPPKRGRNKLFVQVVPHPPGCPKRWRGAGRGTTRSRWWSTVPLHAPRLARLQPPRRMLRASTRRCTTSSRACRSTRA